ncbi:MAG: 50S ribosomal protein L2 [Thermoproteota archaeon]|nr:MAG: 50S ribosomal protein L2 [Candidatus Korarchaeota archaeon]RLG55845.1 MAG: 50S ribosomal protein L2 [Candidatus Korarchaeota archaeon]
MGKRILVQRKGRGGINFRSRKHLKIAPARYPTTLKLAELRQQPVEAQVVEFLHEPGRSAPLAKVKLPDGDIFYYIPPEGVFLGDTIEIGEGAGLKIGNILPLGNIPEGVLVCNIELRPGDGGRLVRAAGAYATVVAHKEDATVIRLPSGREKVLSSKCRATIGVVACGGRKEKPFLKAGTKYYAMKVKATKWPVVRGNVMNPCSHPHGGGSHRRPGKPTTVKRTAPPGQKVGHIAARKTGRGKKLRKTRRT